MNVMIATSTSAAQTKGESRARESVNGHGNSSAPDRCWTAVKARPPNARKTLRPEREASLVAPVGLGDGRDGAVQFDAGVPVVRFILFGCSRHCSCLET